MRVWVTGIGVVSPLARGAAATMDRLLAGDRGIGALTLFQLEGSRATIAAEVRDLRVADVAPGGEDDGWSRTDAMALLAAREALAHAGLDPSRAVIDLAVGGSTAGMFETEREIAAISRAWAADPAAPIDEIAPPRRMLSHPLSSTVDHLCAAAGPFRRARTVCSACSSGANAILLGAAWIRAGRSRAVLAGGADALCRLTYSGFGALAALSPEPCRPFDRRRAGLNLGEGAAFLVLEAEDAARARGAAPIAELAGWAAFAEAHHITNPEASGATAARVMSAALRRAGIGPADVDYVNAHGTATQLNDAMEAAALRRCLGAEADRIAVSSSKGQIGHTLAAAGAIEAAITAMAIARGAMPPTAGLEEIDPECSLVHLLATREGEVRAAMSSSFGFGGTDTVLVLAQPGRFARRDEAPRRVVVTGAAAVGPLGSTLGAAAKAYAEPGPEPDRTIAFQGADHLDLSRARRIDRAGRLLTAAVGAAIRDADLSLDGDAALGVGAIAASAYGNADGSAAFIRRVEDKGAKLASPADFPNLVPSSPIGHASIYLGLRGAVLATCDLDATAESALATAAELIASGDGDAIAAGSVEEASAIIARCLAPACSGVADRGPRSEGAALLLLEAHDHAVARGARVIASVAWWGSWRGDGHGALADAPSPALRSAVFCARDDARTRAAFEGSAWSAVPRRTVAARAGDHEGAGGFAAAAAVGAIAAGELDHALILGVARDRGYAMLLTRGAPP